jgi:hypothetical protein
MKEDILAVQPHFKLYKDRAIFTGAFIGGPLVAGYLAAENFKLLGQTQKVRMVWIVAVFATIVIFGSVFLIPNMEKIPNFLIPIIYSSVAQYMVKKYQGAAIKEHIDLGGPTFSNWRAAWIGLVGLVALVAIIFVVLFLKESASLH